VRSSRAQHALTSSSRAGARTVLLCGELGVKAVAEERVGYDANGSPGIIGEIPPDELARMISDLERQMKHASQQLEFEKAALLRDQIVELRRIQEVV
jgi:excinuclease ABC subunit B